MKKKSMVLCILALASGLTFGDKVETENEFLILGSYFDFKNESSNNSKRNVINIPDTNQAPSEIVPPVVIPPSPVTTSFTVVKENGIEVAKKNVTGEILNYIIPENISSVDQSALWISDKNTSVYNSKILNSNFVSDSIVIDAVVKVEKEAYFENNGIIQGNGMGVQVSEGSFFRNYGEVGSLYSVAISVIGANSVAVNDTAGVLSGGFSVGNEAIGINNGMIFSDKRIGMSIYNGTGVNNGIISNNENWGMDISNGIGINNGVISNNTSIGILISSGTGENWGTISNNGNMGMDIFDGIGINETTGLINNSGKYGMYILNGDGINKGTISNTNDYGMYLSDGYMLYTPNGTGINDFTGIISNQGYYGMFIDSGRVGINRGVISNTEVYGMYIQNGTGINDGIISNHQGFGMYILFGTGKGINNGLISNQGSVGMYIAYGKGENYGVISNHGDYGIEIISGTGTNYGLISNQGDHGIIIFNGSGTGINYGVISNQGDYGIEVSSGIAINETSGVISNTGNYGMFMSVFGFGINNGIISNHGNYGMEVFLGTGVNSGVISNQGDYGMAVFQGTGTNEASGVIENKGDYGMYISDLMSRGTNNGIISNQGNYGMYITDYMSSGTNNGTIHLIGNNKTGVYVKNATFINNGKIIMEGQNTIGIKAENSTVKIASGSEIILKNGAIEDSVTQSNTDFIGNGVGNTSVNGKFYDLDTYSTLVNAGSLSATRILSVQGTGKFVLDSETGTINTKTLNLEKDMYINSSSTLNSSENVYENNNLNVSDITGAGKILSESKLFSANVVKNVSSYSITLTRSSFEDIFTGDLGKVLENNYSGSGNNINQNAIYNSLKTITTESALNSANEELTGQAIISNQVYQQFAQDKILTKSLDQLLDRRNENYNGIYVNFIGEKSSPDGSDDTIGYDGKSYGIILGGMKKVGETTSVGGFFAYLDSHYDYKDSGDSKQDSKTWSIVGVVEKGLIDNLKWTTRLGYNQGSSDTHRKITYDNSNREINGDYDSWSFIGGTELEYKQKINNKISLKPTVGILLDYISQEGYTEKEAAGMNLNVDSTDELSAKVGVGIKADIVAYKNEKHEFMVVSRIDYMYELGNAYGDKTVSLTAFDGNMGITSRSAGRNDLNLGIDVQYSYNDKFSIYTGYGADVLEENESQNISVGFKYQW